MIFNIDNIGFFWHGQKKTASRPANAPHGEHNEIRPAGYSGTPKSRTDKLLNNGTYSRSPKNPVPFFGEAAICNKLPITTIWLLSCGQPQEKQKAIKTTQKQMIFIAISAS